jgi:hypothetical protein
MAMARFFDVDLQSQQQPQRRGSTQQISRCRKIVYVSPSKALCEERFEDWSARLAEMNLGLEVALVTGDGDPSASFRDLAAAHLVLTTPEKVCRNEGRTIMHTEIFCDHDTYSASFSLFVTLNLTPFLYLPRGKVGQSYTTMDRELLPFWVGEAFPD